MIASGGRDAFNRRGVGLDLLICLFVSDEYLEDAARVLFRGTRELVWVERWSA